MGIWDRETKKEVGEMASIWQYCVNFAGYLRQMTVADLVDIVILSFLFYKCIGLFRRTNAAKVARALLLIIIAVWISYQFHLNAINFILNKAVELGLLALVIIRPRSARVSSPSMVTGMSRMVAVLVGFSTLITYNHTPTARITARTMLNILRVFFGLVTIVLPFPSRRAALSPGSCRFQTIHGAKARCGGFVPKSPGTGGGAGCR